MVRQAIVGRFEVVFESDEEGYHVFVPALKGCHSWGETRDDARDQIREAIELWLETAEETSTPIPQAKL